MVQKRRFAASFCPLLELLGQKIQFFGPGWDITSVSFVACSSTCAYPAQARHPSNAPKYRRTQTCLQRGSQLDYWLMEHWAAWCFFWFQTQVFKHVDTSHKWNLWKIAILFCFQDFVSPWNISFKTCNGEILQPFFLQFLAKQTKTHQHLPSFNDLESQGKRFMRGGNFSCLKEESQWAFRRFGDERDRVFGGNKWMVQWFLLNIGTGQIIATSQDLGPGKFVYFREV